MKSDPDTGNRENNEGIFNDDYNILSKKRGTVIYKYECSETKIHHHNSSF
jgi:hypothetical protein